MTQRSFIDLFCGCGGFTLGMQRAGFECLAAIDFNAPAVATLSANLSDVRHALVRDLTKFRPEELAELLGVEHVNVIVGGPPCQGFSTARQVDGANHGDRLKADPRRHLYREFLRYVKFFQPDVFLMENVLGLRSAAGGEYFTRVQREARALGYRVHAQVEDAAALGVPQKRRRQLIVGVRLDLPGYFIPSCKPAPRAETGTMLGDALWDLPPLAAGEGVNEREYDLVRRDQLFEKAGDKARNYLFNVLEVDEATDLTNHVSRPHNERDLRDFKRLNEGENSATAMRDRGVEFEFPYDKSSFKDRYTRQSRTAPCSTIVAHLGKDGLMFIHPTQNRSLTPREAARIQSFPDWFRFPEARTQSFRQIGNAVPPLIAESLGLALKNYLDSCSKEQTPLLFKSKRDAESALHRALSIDVGSLRAMSKGEFLNAWSALLFLFPELHPENAREHGDRVVKDKGTTTGPSWIKAISSKRYARTGWPVGLVQIGREAWKRCSAGQISVEEIYCFPTAIVATNKR